MRRLLFVIGMALAVKDRFPFKQDRCECTQADPGPNFLPNDTIYDKNDSKATMPYQCPSKGMRNKYGVLKFLESAEDEIKKHCNLADNCKRLGRRRNHDKVKNASIFDYIIVGSGAAGAVIAGRLSNTFNKSVLLLEAGDVDPILSRVPSFYKYFRYHRDTDWNFRTEKNKDYCREAQFKCKLNHGRALGGSTIFNDMIYMRGQTTDCEQWYRAFGKKFRNCRDFEPYYLKFESNLDIKENDYKSYHGKSGPMPVQKFKHRHKMIKRIVDASVGANYEAIQELMISTTKRGGFGIADSFQANGQRFTPARAYLHPRRENLLIVLRAQVTKILFNDNHAYAVVFALNEQYDKLKTVKATYQIIISAGVFNTAKILLLSGVGPSRDLKKHKIDVVKDLPVGEEVKFHYGMKVRYAIGYHADHKQLNPLRFSYISGQIYYWESAMLYLKPTNNMRNHYWADLLDEDALDEYLEFGTGPLASNGLTQLVGLFNRNMTETTSKPEIQMIFEGFQADCSRTDRQNLTFPYKDYYPTSGSDFALNSTKLLQVNRTRKAWRLLGGWYDYTYDLTQKRNTLADLDVVQSRKIDIFILLLNPASTGNITLRSANAGDPPIINGNFFTERDDLFILYQGFQHIDKIMRSKGLRDLRLDIPLDYFRNCGAMIYRGSNYRGLMTKWYSKIGYYHKITNRNYHRGIVECLARQYTVARYHQQGTVPLGDVLNEYYGVKGLTGLRVCDGSILSGPITGSPQGTIMMFAEHLSELLIEESTHPDENKMKFAMNSQKQVRKDSLDYYQ